jgi:heat shock protein HslJ
MLRVLAYTFSALILATSVAEAQSRRRDPTPPRPPTRAEQAILRSFPAGERLVVISLSGRPPVSSDRPQFTFSSAFRMSGFGGCNPVGADFRVGVRDIRFGHLHFVERRCSPEIDRYERALFIAIQSANQWRATGRRGLTLSGRRGTVVFGSAI